MLTDSIFLQGFLECQFGLAFSFLFCKCGMFTNCVLCFSTKMALKEAEERQQGLEAEVTKVTQEMKQKQEEINTLKEGLEEHRSAKEEISRYASTLQAVSGSLTYSVFYIPDRTWLEVQSSLAQKEEDMTAREMSQTALISQLQLQIKEREEALRQREEQGGQSVAQHRDEMETAQKLIKKVSQEKEELMEELQQERQEKATIQTVLDEKCGSLESECKDHQKTRSQVLKLEAELKKQLEKAMQMRDQLQAHLEELQQKDEYFQTQLGFIQEKNQSLQRELEQQREGGCALQEQLQVLTQEKVTLQWEMEEQRQDLQRQIDEAQKR